MATNIITKKPCCKCNKGGATFTCDGCHQSFCLKHVGDHRQELAQQMDNIGQQHDVLKRDIDEQSINKALLAQIDRWEQESIEKIRSHANKARTDLKRLAEESKTRLSELMSELSNELRSNRESDEYTEDDLDRWANQLKELRKGLKKSSEMDIVDDTLSSFRSIKISKKDPNETISITLPQNVNYVAEKFSEKVGRVVLSQDRCSAICTSDFDSISGRTTYASVCGSRRYSCNIYHLQFRLNTSPGKAVFFGIMESSQTIVEESSALKFVYGYWSDRRPVIAGSYVSPYESIQIQPNDVVSFILDCSSRKISYIHERTQMRYEMKVDQKICPFPWKLVVTLWYPNDKIEILN
jgi:hypothetical protein